MVSSRQDTRVLANLRMTNGVLLMKTAAERKASTSKTNSRGEAKAHDTEDEDEISDFSQSEVQDIVCGLQHVQTEADTHGDGWQAVSKGSRTTPFKEYQSNMPVFEDKDYWSKIAAEKETNGDINVTISSEDDLDDLL